MSFKNVAKIIKGDMQINIGLIGWFKNCTTINIIECNSCDATYEPLFYSTAFNRIEFIEL